ncbi:MAG: hypothetical protein AAF805_13910 [Planctomycetota bacterium]
MTGSKFITGAAVLLGVVAADPESTERLLKLGYCTGGAFCGAWAWVRMRPKREEERSGWWPDACEWAGAFVSGIGIAPFASDWLPGDGDMSHWLLGGVASGALSTPIVRYVLSRPTPELLGKLGNLFRGGNDR